jgi:NAD(P)-dependent dehydrogenase (short-subunit alcohol dehydrogenase family)
MGEMAEMKLDGKVALVTGSSRGIGAAIARRFAESGAKVVVNGRDEAAIDAVRSDIESRGGKAIGVAADVTDFDAMERMREAIERELGPVDVLVANAGTPEDLAEAALFLASDASAWISGVVLDVAGGSVL